MNELALFAGAGGGLLASKELGWRTVCAVEQHPYAASVLVSRQNDGALEPFQIWNDVCTFDGRPWRGAIDIISGGFPCQDISSANLYATGISGRKSSLWKQFARIIGEVRPKFAFIENSPRLRKLGLDVVLSDLYRLGYDAEWCLLSGYDVSAPHKRQRCWILAYHSVHDEIEHGGVQEGERTEPGREGGSSGRRFRWVPEPALDRMAHGVADRMDRLYVLGNGQIPQCAAEAFRILHGRIPTDRLPE